MLITKMIEIKLIFEKRLLKQKLNLINKEIRIYEDINITQWQVV